MKHLALSVCSALVGSIIVAGCGPRGPIHSSAPLAASPTQVTRRSPLHQIFCLTKNFRPTSVLSTGSKSVWVAGYQRNRFVLLASLNGGVKWTKISVPSPIPGQLANTSALAQNHDNLAVPQIAVKPGGHIGIAWRGLRKSVVHVALTHNDGHHWNLTTVAVNGPMANWVSAITFVNAQDGWLLVGGGGFVGSAPLWIYRTTDGGAQWHATTRMVLFQPTCPPTWSFGRPPAVG